MNETKCGRAYNDKPKSETYIEFRPEKGGDESQLPQGNMNMVNGGERESAEEALGSIRRGRGGRGAFFFWRKGRLEEQKKEPRSHCLSAVWLWTHKPGALDWGKSTWRRCLQLLGRYCIGLGGCFVI